MTRILVEIEGGIVQRVSADGPVDVLIRDLDTEGASDWEICPPMSEEYAPSYIYQEQFEDADISEDSEALTEFNNLWTHFQKHLEEGRP